MGSFTTEPAGNPESLFVIENHCSNGRDTHPVCLWQHFFTSRAGDGEEVLDGNHIIELTVLD